MSFVLRLLRHLRIRPPCRLQLRKCGSGVQILPPAGISQEKQQNGRHDALLAACLLRQGGAERCQAVAAQEVADITAFRKVSHQRAPTLVNETPERDWRHAGSRRQFLSSSGSAHGRHAALQKENVVAEQAFANSRIA